MLVTTYNTEKYLKTIVDIQKHVTNDKVRFNVYSLQDVSETDLHSRDTDERVQDIVIDLRICFRDDLGQVDAFRFQGFVASGNKIKSFYG